MSEENTTLEQEEENTSTDNMGDREDGANTEEANSQDAADFVEDILDLMDLDVLVSIRGDERELVLDLEGPDVGRAIGKKGQTLEALQFLTNRIVGRDMGEPRYIVLDSGDYRERHERNLLNRATKQAKRAVREGRTVSLEPMSPRDRRLVHMSLAKIEGIATESTGSGSGRRIQIIPED